MEIWHIWIIAALLLFIVEIFTSGFAVICIAVGALGGAVATLLNAPFWGQLLAFAVVTLIALFTVRPLMMHTCSKKLQPCNMEALKGGEVSLVNPIGEDIMGRVKIYGDEWQAVSDNGEEIAAGAKVRIVGQDSNILIVHNL